MTRPRLTREITYRHGLAAAALFAVLAWVFATATFGDAAGFEAGVSVTAGIGYALFDMPAQSSLVTEGFLIAFEIIDVVLVAALVGAVMLARREGDRTVATDGGRTGGED